MLVYAAIKKGKGTLVGSYVQLLFANTLVSSFPANTFVSNKIYLSLSLARPLRSLDTIVLAFTLCAFTLISIELEFVKNLSKSWKET